MMQKLQSKTTVIALVVALAVLVGLLKRRSST